MIDRCNRCQVEPLRGLPALGEIYALRMEGDRTHHYWLCEECAKEHILQLNAVGGLLVADRRATEAQAVSSQADLRLVFRLADAPTHESGSRIYACSAMD
jgi:hypothetical protein